MKRFAVLLCVAVATALACSDQGTDPVDPDPVPTTLGKVGGDQQTGTVGSALPQALTVRVRDQTGSAMGGVSVNWNVTAGGGSVSSSSSTTDANGEAAVSWILGTAAGGNSAGASVSGIAASVVFEATGEPDRPAKVILSETTLTFTALGDTAVVTAAVEDRHGNALPEAELIWTTGDSLVAVVDDAGRVVSRGQGSALIVARADTSTGTVTVHVQQQVSSLTAEPASATLNALGDTATFTATAHDANGHAVPGAAITWASLDEAVATIAGTGRAVARAIGEAQISATAGALADTVSLLVRQLTAAVAVTPSRDTLTAGDTVRFTAVATDSNGFAIADAGFAWASSDTAVASVDADGLVQGKLARNATLTATSANVSGAAEVWVIGAGPAASMTAFGGDGQTGPAGEPLPDPVVVRVADAYGNPVPGESVSWTAGAGHGAPGAASSTSDADGLAMVEWTLGLHSGADTLTASHPGLGGAPIDFAATATPNGTITGTISLSSTLLSTSLAGSGSTAPTATVDRPAHVPGSLIVTYRPEAVDAPRVGAAAFRSARTAEAVASRIRARTAARGADLAFELNGVSPVILAARIRVDPARLEGVRAALLSDPAVQTVERERTFHHSAPEARHRPTDRAAAVFPRDPLYAPQAWHYEMIDMPEAWAYETGSTDIVVAVIDDGIRFDHPAIAPNLTADGYDFTSQGSVTICGTVYDRAHDGDGPDPDPTIPTAIDQNSCTFQRYGGHGLHVAGTVGAAGDDGVGTTGVSWSVAIRPIRVFGIEGSAYALDVANGILYAAGLPVDIDGTTVQASTAARVINMSLGSSGSSTAIQNAVQAAAAAGSLLVAAAGNSNTSSPSYPAAYPEVISVAAVAPDRQRASYSNYGSTIDIAAPGGEMALGADFGVASTTWDFVDGVPSYQWFQGTSMASPHVAGVAALLVARDPGLTAAALRARLLDYAIDLGPVGRDDQYGHGLLNARNSLTETPGPIRAIYARLYDANTGQLLQTVAADASGTYAFSALEDGEYHVYGGEDRDGDGLVGLPGRRWGTYTGTATAVPSTITIDGAGDHAASFVLGFASELEPNDSPGSANVLPVGGHFHGRLATASDADYYVVTIPVAGTYTFETSGWDGACGYAYEEDTILSLYGSDGGSLLASNDDIDAAGRNFCSRISQTLSAGTYYLRVTGYADRYYRLEARNPL